jgi:hypothetical protein
VTNGALDWVLLGMGADGHTASIFPGSADATDSDDGKLVSCLLFSALFSHSLTFYSVFFHTGCHIEQCHVSHSVLSRIKAICTSSTLYPI